MVERARVNILSLSVSSIQKQKEIDNTSGQTRTCNVECRELVTDCYVEQTFSMKNNRDVDTRVHRWCE